MAIKVKTKGTPFLLKPFIEKMAAQKKWKTDKTNLLLTKQVGKPPILVKNEIQHAWLVEGGRPLFEPPSKAMKDALKQFPKSKFLIEVRKQNWLTIPVMGDILNLSTLMRAGKVNGMAIASTDKSDRLIGYVFYKLRNPIPKEKYVQLYKEMLQYYLHTSGERVSSQLSELKRLVSWGKSKLEVKFVPFRGYSYDPWKGNFVKKPAN